MISLDYGTLRSDTFRNAFVKLGSSEDVSRDTAIKLIEVSRKLEAKLIESQDEWLSLMRGMVEIENGKFKLNDEKTDFVWLDDVDPDVGKSKIMSFVGKTVEIDSPKFDLGELKNVKLSAVELALIDPILKK